MKTLRLIVAISALLLSTAGHAITVIEINTEWLWDHLAPDEGRIIGQRIPAPSEGQYRDELAYYASLIDGVGAEVVGLVELEGCHVARDLARVLGGVWQSACLKGRDSYTGQDVAILSKFHLNLGTATTFQSHYAYAGSKRIRPSKVLSVIAERDGERFLLTVTHLISQRGSQDAKRVAQAQAIRSGLAAMANRYPVDHKILMGDINDVPGSATLETLKLSNLINPADAGDCSYTYRGRCLLIDHILVSPELAGGELQVIDMPKKFSDHDAVIYRSGNKSP